MSKYRVRSYDVVPTGFEDERYSGMTVRLLVDAALTGSEYAVVGHSLFPAGRTTHEAHSHPNAEELIVVLAGTGRQRVGDEIFNITEGDVIYVPKGVIHVAESAENEDLTMVWIYAGASSMEEAGYVGTGAFGVSEM